MKFNDDINFDKKEEEKETYRNNVINVNLPPKSKEQDDIEINSLFKTMSIKKLNSYAQKLRNEKKELLKKLEEKENTINKLNTEMEELKSKKKEQKEEIEELKIKIKEQKEEIEEFKIEKKELKKEKKEEIKELKEKINELKQLIKGPNELEMILAPQKRIIEQSQNDIINRQSQIIDILQENRGGIENKDEEIKRLKEIIEEKNEEIKKTKMIIADCSRNIMFGVKDHFQQEGRQSTVDIIDNIIKKNNEQKEDEKDDDDFNFDEKGERDLTCNSTLEKEKLNEIRK